MAKLWAVAGTLLLVAACGGNGDGTGSTTTTTVTSTTLPLTTTSTTGKVTYTVQPGDTLSEIAQQFATTVEALAQANDISDPNVIAVGQILEIPSP